MNPDLTHDASRTLTWKALYIYLHRVSLQEKLITTVAPLLNETGKPWFFIKYWHGGPHVRLRFTEDSEAFEQELTATVASFIRDNPAPSLEANTYYENNSLDGEALDIATLPWYEHGTYFSAVYEPEYDRYGRGELLLQSEMIFYHSSVFASELFQRGIQFGKRILIAALLMKRTLELTGHATPEFLERYVRYWRQLETLTPISLLSQKHTVIEFVKRARMEEIERYLDTVRPYWSRIRELTDAHGYIVSSQLHMMNNRLSVVPSLEWQLAVMLHEVVDATYSYEKRGDTRNG